MSASKKSKKNGVIGTILFHSILLTSFFFLGLTYQDPPPPEEGISINLGSFDKGSNTVEPEANDEKIDITQEEVIEKQTENNEEIITQNTIETTATKTTEKKQEKVIKDEPLEEIIEEEKPELNTKALYTGKKENNEKSKGENSGKGNQGIIEGDANASEYEGGGIGSDGDAYQLGGRNVEFKPKPIYEIQVEGKVVVIITVNRSGNVITAIPGAKGSTTLNKQLLQKAKAAALKTKFSPKQSAPTNQQGKIIYYFSLN